MIVRCHNCHRRLKIDDRLAGKKSRCPACKQIIVIPDPSSRPATSSCSPPAPPPIPQKTPPASTSNQPLISSNPKETLPQLPRVQQSRIIAPPVPRNTQKDNECRDGRPNMYGIGGSFLCGLGILIGCLLPILLPGINGCELYFPNIQVLWENPLDLPVFLLSFPILIGILTILWYRGVARAFPDHQKALVVMGCVFLLAIAALLSGSDFLSKEAWIWGYILLLMLGISTGIGVQKVDPESRFGRWLAGISGLGFFIFLFLPVLQNDIGPMPIQAPFRLFGLGPKLMLAGLILLALLGALIVIALLACLTLRFNAERNPQRGALIIRFQLVVYVSALVLGLAIAYAGLWDGFENGLMSRPVYILLPFLVATKIGLILLGLMSAFSIAAVRMYVTFPKTWSAGLRKALGQVTSSTQSPSAGTVRTYDEMGQESRLTCVDPPSELVDLRSKLAELQQLRDEGLVSLEEFQSAKKELLAKWTRR